MLDRLSDRGSARGSLLVVAATLFVLAAWPLLLVELPPFQDLPNHVATAHIVAHHELYPELVFNGYFKSNSLLMAWLDLAGPLGLLLAARLYVAFVLALNALALPLFVLRFAGRRAMVVSALFLWPLVHGFFVSMGMLNFAPAVALALLLLVLLDRQREEPRRGRALAVAGLACLLWFAHPLPMAVVVALAAWEVLRAPGFRARLRLGAVLLLPLVPAGALSAASALAHLMKADHAPAAAATSFVYLNPLAIVEHVWLDASGAFTRWGSMTLLPAILLPLYAWKARHRERPFFSRSATVGLLAAYVVLPYMMSNWWYLNCRLVPFLWAAMLLRVPERLPRAVAAALAVAAVGFSLVLGLDYVRLDRDRAELTAGIEAVPRRATLLPLLFAHRKTSQLTASLTHAWAYYTLAKDTSAPLVFAVERSYPITYATFPPPALSPPALDNFAENNRRPSDLCKRLRDSPLTEACGAAWRDLWQGFWHEAEPRFTHVLTWAMTDEARALMPSSYRRVFARGELEIYARDAGRSP